MSHAKLLQSCPTLWPHGLLTARLLCPWDFLGENTVVSCHFLLQGIFPTQECKPCPSPLLHWQTGSLPLASPGKAGFQVTPPWIQNLAIPLLPEEPWTHELKSRSQEIRRKVNFHSPSTQMIFMIFSILRFYRKLPRWLNGTESACQEEAGTWSLGWEDPLEKEMAIHFTILAWEIPWTKEPGGLQSMGSQKSQIRLSNWTTTNRCVTR